MYRRQFLIGLTSLGFSITPSTVVASKNSGTVFNIVGNAASQIQFFLTDSSKNFLVGALYFYSKPNYDSIYPALKFIEKDLYRLIESFEWEQ